MSDEVEAADLWPVSVKKTIASHNRGLLRLKKQSIKETKQLDRALGAFIPENGKSNYSEDFFSERNLQPFVPKNVESKYISEDSTRCFKLESQLNSLLEAVLKDTLPKAKSNNLQKLNLDLKQLFSSLIDSELQGNGPVEYSPQLAPVLQRIALTNLITLDTPNCTVEFLT